MAKHGNFAATSVSGASNVIKNHGVEFTDDLDKLNRSMDEANIVYLHVSTFAKAMKFVGPIRKALQFPTGLIFWAHWLILHNQNANFRCCQSWTR